MSYLTPLPESSWDSVKSRHLLNRAGFGIPYSRSNELVRMGLSKAVSAFVDVQAVEDNFTDPSWVQEKFDADAIAMAAKLLGKDEGENLMKQARQEERQQIHQLQFWWLKRMTQTKRPLQEKMALFWHGHFATSAQKIKNASANYHLNQIFRKNGMGNFKTLVTQVGQSPAMLRYLDNMQNVKGKPNENWARELMELFTLGIGNYTEQDIKEAARAFTGWTQRNGEFFNNVRQHDFGPKTFLGRTGNFDGNQIIDILFEQKAVSEFLPKKLWEFFVHEEPSPALVAELSQVFRENQFEIAPLLRAIFLSNAFYSASAMKNQIKSPIQLLLGLFDGLELDFLNSSEEEEKQIRGRLLQLAMRQLGQELFFPPNVKGWPGNRAWINTNTILIRYNLSAFLVNGVQPQNPRRLELDEMIDSAEQERMNRRFEKIQNRAPFNAMAFFAPYEGFTLGEVIDFLTDRFLGQNLDHEQRNMLIQAFQVGSETTVLSLQSIPERHLRSVIHLTLSLAEYQLC